MGLYIGIDLGGTKIAGGVWDSDALTMRAQKTIPAQAQAGPDAVIQRIADLARELAGMAGLAMTQIAGVGLAVPASIDSDAGVIWVIPNLPGDWRGKPVGPILRGMLDCPVYLVNDARAFTLAEATIGAGKGSASCVGITLGTGIGGGIAINGRLYLGVMGSAGEFGHHTIDMHGPPDGTGNPGALEAMASGPSIAAMGIKAVAQGITTQIGALVNFDLNKITPEIIAQAAESGDKIARDILQTAGTYLGVGLSNILILLAPEKVVIGGGVAQLGKWIMEPIQAEIKRRVVTTPLDKCELVLAALGGEAGVVGAAIWASQQEINHE